MDGKALWQVTTYKLKLHPKEEQERRLIEYLNVSKYSWNWALAQWQFMEAMHRAGRQGAEWPTEKLLCDIWSRRMSPGIEDVPASIAELSIRRMANMYMTSRSLNQPLPPVLGPSLKGAFRIARADCSLKDGVFGISGAGSMEATGGTDDLDWESVLYVTIMHYTKSGFYLYAVKGKPDEIQFRYRIPEYGEFELLLDDYDSDYQSRGEAE